MYEPLYKRVRPINIEEFVGQHHLLGKNKPLRVMIERGTFTSFIFYGPPGTGKTLLAEIIARSTDSHFVKLSAVTSGISDMCKAVEEAKRWRGWGKKTILFVDEIHRFNKAQQEFLLPFIEDGVIILIGASTENPIFALTKALSSRIMVFEFKPLSKEELLQILERAILKAGIRTRFTKEALECIAERAGGDARKALSFLELIAFMELERVSASDVENILGVKAYFKYSDDEHYNVISAFIKSVRGSDPDAALYWLSIMLKAGEDPLYITRRLMILAAEDIGMADPIALPVAVAAHEAVSHVGMPEAELILAFATVYLATCLKSNSCYIAIRKAMDEVDKLSKVEVPVHLMDARSYEKLKSDKEKYIYPHDYPEAFVKQLYKPNDSVYYFPKPIGYEKEIVERLKRWWNERYSKKKDN